MQPLVKEKTNKVVFISVLIIIFLTDSLLFSTSNIAILNLIKRFSPVLLAFAFILFNKFKILPGVLFACISIALTMVYVGRVFDGYSYITQISLLLCGYYYSTLVSFEEFKKFFIQWMRIIAIVSLVAFLLDSVIRGISFIPTITNSVDNSYKCLFFTNVPLSTSFGRRNWGPFWEPGTYQCYLNMALLFSVFSDYKKKNFDILLFIVTALSTMSGAAILPMPFIILAYLFNSNKAFKEKKFFLIFFMCITIIVAIGSGAFDEVIEKATGGVSEENYSSGFRIGSMEANIKAALKYPLLGAPPETQDEMRKEIIGEITGRPSIGNTNTLFAYFSYYGILVGCYYTSRLIAFTKNLSVNVVSRIFIFLAIFLATSNENLMSSSLINVLLFIGLKDIISTQKSKGIVRNAAQSNANRRNL